MTPERLNKLHGRPPFRDRNQGMTAKALARKLQEIFRDRK